MSTPFKEHPTVRAHQQRPALQKTSEPLDAAWLRQLCLDAGADDVGFLEIDPSGVGGGTPAHSARFSASEGERSKSGEGDLKIHHKKHKREHKKHKLCFCAFWVLFCECCGEFGIEDI
jgi:hypothetical protein